MRQKWEYRVTPAYAVPEMDGLGMAGWELVAIYERPTYAIANMYWKRPLPEPVDGDKS